MANPQTREDFEAIATAAANEHGISPELVKAVIDQETGGSWNPIARSPAGAVGLMQLMPDAAREVGLKPSERNDPIKNIQGGVRYLRRLIDRFGDTGLALAAYNWGPTRVARLLENPRRMRIAEETKRYVPAVFSRMGQFGPVEAPTATALAFFPDLKDVMAADTMRAVRAKTGGSSADSIARDISTGQLPTSGLDPGALGGEEPARRREILAQEPAPGGLPMPTGAQGADIGAAGAPEPLPVPPRGPGAKNYPDLRAFLKAQFGPLSEVADPLPKTFDSELSRLIDRA